MSYEITVAMNLLVETDVKWLNWANAAGYKDFDWNNQWVYAIGVHRWSRRRSSPSGRIQLCQEPR